MSPTVLFAENLSWAEKLGAWMHRHTRPVNVDVSESVQAARLGLMVASSGWKNDGRCTFRTYARHRVKGRVRDEWRNASMDSAWRTHRLRERYQFLPILLPDGNASFDDTDPSPGPDHELEVRSELSFARRYLSDRDARILERLAEGEEQQKIAADLGLSGSRMSQIVAVARVRVRRRNRFLNLDAAYPSRAKLRKGSR
jgi:RNA polymerase sigma factor (sigma-70 family)